MNATNRETDRQALIDWLEAWERYLAAPTTLVFAPHPYPPTPEQFRRWAELVKEER